MKQFNNGTIESVHFESLYPATSRQEEIKQLIDFVTKGQSCQIVSLAGVGRSNLLGLLSYNRNVRITYFGEKNQKWFHFVLINVAEVKGKPLADVTKFLFLSLADSLRDRKLTKEHDLLHKIFKEHYSFHDELILFQGLKEALYYLTIEKELTVVFLFDRFEEYIPVLTEQFFSNLRVLRNQSKYRFSAVFSLNRPLEDTIEPSLMADFSEFLAGNIIYIPVKDDAGLQFRIEYLQKISSKKLTPELIAKTLNLTGHHGKLTRLCIEHLLSFSPTPDIKDLDSTFLLQKSIRSALLEIWNSLTPSEQVLLLQNEEQRESSAEPYLESVGLIKENKIQIPLFERYSKEEFGNTNLPHQTITLHSQTGAITKGATAVSDKLTGLEYRLLTFLINNANRVLTRQEVIDAVWQGAKSTAGVTDQAVDQLISRTRKKIEDNPNQPTHLKTIKGRGFEFAP